MRKIELVNRNDWTELFNKESQVLCDIIGDCIHKVHHIGSTAINNILAKPVIDIILEVNSLEALDSHNQKMTDVGYTPMGEFGIEGRRFFTKGGDDRTHHIHAFIINDPNIIRHLAFRDYLNNNSELAEEYEKLKVTLQSKFATSPQEYSIGKNDLIQSLESKAMAWYKVQNKEFT